MRKLKYYVACSIDGFIAHEDGTWDGFLFEGEHVSDYLESLNLFDVVFMGRKTYEMGLKEGKTDPYPTMKSYVFSRTMKESPDQRVQVISENVAALVTSLKEEMGQDIYLCGGGNLATRLLGEKLIDEIILKVNPFLMGSGIPLFARVAKQTELELTDNKIYENGVVVLRYQVKY
ncbi:dihydrofolate reductase family protein [Lyngbya aestuarii]|uniref:dihydrofolate reductase family protein n=1 Tax=Lyngbya aestuarii TaxID=118322 RepID=UPI00403E09DB